ncbi:Pyridoxamine 5'-phosphate oxidase-related, FMN-binding [Desulfosporosinus sp. I2]|uniref:pyridoxamine 5'-phosphate oxidase family protein n=1 Tax=Desulfosporosinus sp. I2 TaxID=1617025 RepID=UPI0005EEDA6D|nr:pyridoxamine 5'-phosphate oxidase family protein [Desulfosporosinus sp. I2]KJR44797.1 Pyridoxamine 5'-phosphate oxidase-related, FMN-binding [Desulfosporosinus sp. I2]
MLNEKLLDVLSHPSDGAVSIVTNGDDGPHLVNTWNSYIVVTPDDKLLIPAYGFNKTERNLSVHNDVILSIASREIEGYKAKGTGFIVKGTTRFVKSGGDFDRMKERFSWVRAVLEITVTSAKQML